MIADGFHDVPAGKVAMVVTHLEMKSPVEIKSTKTPDGIEFRQVLPDVTWYRDILDRVGRDWLWFGRGRLTDAQLAEILSNPNVAVYTLSKNGRDEALLELDYRQEGECEIAFLGLTKSLIGTGAGRFMINYAIRLAWEKPIQRFHVHTCTLDSPQALQFYIRSGFTPYKQQIEIDDDPRLTGVLPRDAAAQIPVFD